MLAVGLLFAVGLGSARFARPPAHAHRALEWVVLTVGLPALILLRLAPARLGWSVLVPAVVAWAFLGGFAALLLLVGRHRLSRAQMGALLLIIPIGNTSFLGLPAVRAIAGDASVPTVLLYDQLGTFLAIATYGAVVVAVWSSGSAPTLGSIARKVVAFPPFIATVCALPIALWCSLRGVEFVWPAPLEAMLGYAGAVVAPAALWAVALRAVSTTWGKPDRLLVAAVGTKLVLAPAVVLGVVTLAGMHRSFELDVSLLELAMPSSVTASAIAADAGFEPDLCARVAAVGLVASFVTLPLWGAILGF